MSSERTGAEGKLPEGWVRDENGALRRETIHSMLRRFKGWDYRARAIYQITITLEDRASGALARAAAKVEEVNPKRGAD